MISDQMILQDFRKYVMLYKLTLSNKMAIETTVFTFKISISFKEWVKGFDSPEVSKMHEVYSVKPLYRGVSKVDPYSVIVIHQAEEGKAKAMFEASRKEIEKSGHIWDSTLVTSYLAN